MSQDFDYVKIIAGKGIVLNNDSILIDRTTLRDLMKMLKIDKEPSMSICDWSGRDFETKKDTGGQYSQMELNYKTLNFSFTTVERGTNNERNFKLSSIKIGNDETIKAYTDNGIELGDINPNIKEKFPETGKYDLISDTKEYYDLRSYGITFSLKELNNDLKVYRICVLRIMK